MEERVQIDSYYLDDRLSLAECTRVFAHDGGGRETAEEGFYSVAIRRIGFRECVYRFPNRDRATARSMLEALNRAAAAAAWPSSPS
jgi:hypothetical protein